MEEKQGKLVHLLPISKDRTIVIYELTKDTITFRNIGDNYIFKILEERNITIDSTGRCSVKMPNGQENFFFYIQSLDTTNNIINELNKFYETLDSKKV